MLVGAFVLNNFLDIIGGLYLLSRTWMIARWWLGDGRRPRL